MRATQKLRHRWLAGAAVLATAVAGAIVAADPATAAPAAGSAHAGRQVCTQATVPVSVVPGLPATDYIWGQLCTPRGHQVDSVQLLVHGLSYSHYYWDPAGLNPYQYSYVRDAGLAGLATFNIDRIGVGKSSHPASYLITLESNAYTVHQVVSALHTGVAGHRFGSVSLVGHSYGSEIAQVEASDYADVDSLVLTSTAHRQSPTANARTTELGEPASADPRLAAEVPPGDYGYVTLQDAFRPELMYNQADSDPAVIAADIAHKETLTYSEVATLADGLSPTVTGNLRIPVLIVDGTADRLVCASDATDCSSAATLAAAEQPFYPQTVLSTYVVPGAGHAIDLHRNGWQAFAKIICWSLSHTPR